MTFSGCHVEVSLERKVDVTRGTSGPEPGAVPARVSSSRVQCVLWGRTLGSMGTFLS